MDRTPHRIHRILVVEDNPGDAHLTQEAFSECGYVCDLTFADSHVAAEQLLGTDSFDLLFCDFGGDYRGSAQFFKAVRERVPTLPIIVLSGYPDAAPAYLAGANAFIRKNADLNELFTKIQDTMHFWVAVAELSGGGL